MLPMYYILMDSDKRTKSIIYWPLPRAPDTLQLGNDIISEKDNIISIAFSSLQNYCYMPDRRAWGVSEIHSRSSKGARAHLSPPDCVCVNSRCSDIYSEV